MKVTKRQFYIDIFVTNISNSKKVWKGIKQIVHLKSQGQSFTNQNTQKQYCQLTDTKSIANAFNKYFANIGNHLASTIPNVDKSPQGYLTSHSCDSFYLFPTTAEEIENEISSLKTGKADSGRL